MRVRLHLRERLLGHPDGTLIRARCLVLGHKWWPCEPQCCNKWWCERCNAPGPLLEADTPSRWWKP